MQIKFDRSQGLGGSDIPVLLGLSSWKTPYDLYLEKITGKVDEDKLSENGLSILDLGKLLEPYIIEYYEKKNNKKVNKQQEIIYHPVYNFLWATIDGMQDKTLIEVKTTSSYVDAWKNGIPPYVGAQISYYCHLTNADDAQVIVLFRDTGKIIIHDYERNLLEEEYIIQRAIKFWDNIQHNIIPEPSNYQEAQKIFSNTTDKKIIASTEDIECINRMKILKQEIEEREATYEELKLNICKRLGNANILEDFLENCLVTWKEKAATKISSDLLKKKYAEIYDECSIKTTNRTFLLKK
jgi:putative phage-type endonuclease